MTVDSPLSLLLLALLGPTILLLALSYRRSQRDLAALQRMARPTAAAAGRGRAVFRGKRIADAVLVTVTLTCVMLAAAGVRWGERIREDVRTGTEVVAVVDLSRSMAARDAGTSRLEQGLAALSVLLDRLAGTRVALVGFSDTPHLLLPFTDDRHALQQQIEALRAIAPALGGSGLESALRFAAVTLAGRPGAGRVILLVSDGEASHGSPVAAARAAGHRGIPIVVLPMGSTAGAPVPDATGAPLAGADGIVLSRRDDRVLSEIARVSGGLVVESLRAGSIDAALTSLRLGERDPRATAGGGPPGTPAAAPSAAPESALDSGRSFQVEPRSRYPLLVLLALLALGAAVLNRAWRWRDTF